METATEELGFDRISNALETSHTVDADPGDTWNNELLSEVTREYGPKLRIYLSHNLRIYDDIDDLLQELYIRIINYPKPSNVRSLRAFVFTIATNLLRDKSRRSYTRLSNHSVSIDTVDIPIEHTDPGKIAEDRDQLHKLNQAIEHLQPNCKKAFLQHRVEGKSYKEIALGMGVTVSMVEKHIINALKQLRHCIDIDQ